MYTRSQIVVAAKAFGVDAIDMVGSLEHYFSIARTNPPGKVCINYKDPDYLKDECEDGRRLGFNGKVTSQPLNT